MIVFFIVLPELPLPAPIPSTVNNRSLLHTSKVVEGAKRLEPQMYVLFAKLMIYENTICKTKYVFFIFTYISSVVV
jgi:hypothetical protein